MISWQFECLLAVNIGTLYACFNLIHLSFEVLTFYLQVCRCSVFTLLHIRNEESSRKAADIGHRFQEPGRSTYSKRVTTVLHDPGDMQISPKMFRSVGFKHGMHADHTYVKKRTIKVMLLLLDVLLGERSRLLLEDLCGSPTKNAFHLFSLQLRSNSSKTNHL